MKMVVVDCHNKVRGTQIINTDIKMGVKSAGGLYEGFHSIIIFQAPFLHLTLEIVNGLGTLYIQGDYIPEFGSKVGE